MAKEWTDDEVKSEIAAAIAIVREDKFEAFVRSRFPSPANPNPNPNSPSPANGNNPDANGGGQKQKKSLWWGIPEETS